MDEMDCGNQSELKGELISEETARARRKALAVLSVTDKSEHDLRDRLKRAGFGSEAEEDAVQYVKRYGYLDDRRFAEHYIDVMQNKKSRKKIEFELLNRGIDRSLIEEAFSCAGETDEKELIRKTLLKKFGRQDLTDENVRRKAVQSLGRQGFGVSDILSVLDTILEKRYI